MRIKSSSSSGRHTPITKQNGMSNQMGSNFKSAPSPLSSGTVIGTQHSTLTTNACGVASGVSMNNITSATVSDFNNCDKKKMIACNLDQIEKREMTDQLNSNSPTLGGSPSSSISNGLANSPPPPSLSFSGVTAHSPSGTLTINVNNNGIQDGISTKSNLNGAKLTSSGMTSPALSVGKSPGEFVFS